MKITKALKRQLKDAVTYGEQVAILARNNIHIHSQWTEHNLTRRPVTRKDFK